MSQRTTAFDDRFGFAAAPEARMGEASGSTAAPAKWSADADMARRLQIVMSPYYGKPDFSELTEHYEAHAQIDLVSVADLLRNGFVYAPHSIFEEVKLACLGFDPSHDMHDSPEFHYLFRDSGRRPKAGETSTDWVESYHRLLCGAYAAACDEIRSPWLLQSGGKDSTPLAIASAEVRPDTRCITYLGGREENEVDSATLVADKLGLRHHTLVCDPGRAYDRYLSIMRHIPLLTADFALLSYVDLATTIAEEGGDGIVDGMGADSYFGISVHWREQMLLWLARNMRLPRRATELPLLGRNFELCYLLSTLQMDPIERVFPGSRFTDAEIDALFGRDIAQSSKSRLALFRPEIDSATSSDEYFAMANSIAGVAGGFAKGLYTASAMSMHVAYPFCDRVLREWVYREVPSDQRIDPITRANKVLVRRHIESRFPHLPYVARKGSFRFDLCGLANQRFDQVHAYAVQARDVLPGAVEWLERNRGRLGNKYHASKFYLLAIVLPWLVWQRDRAQSRQHRIQITMSPYYGKPDFSRLGDGGKRRSKVDRVSMADLLRNGFVYPPHSIYEDVKLATFGFDPRRDMHDDPQFHFGFRDSGKRPDSGGEEDAVTTYHRLLCEALAASCAKMRNPWLLQSGGKDSTTLSIAAAQARPDTVCVTYLGGREENEIASALAVAQTLGLRHEVLICDPGRAYDRYLAMLPRMPLLTADFALLSYADMATEIAQGGGDGTVDGLGSDIYFGTPMHSQHRVLSWLARDKRLPQWATELPLLGDSFKLCYLISTLQMVPSERLFPGSRFTDTEVDALFGRDIARLSKARLAMFRSEIMSVTSSDDDWKAITLTISEAAGGFAKGLYTANALSLRVAYPFCDRALREWVYGQVPSDQHIDPVTRANKALVRRHIATRFDRLPYVEHKGCFRFDLCGLAKARFDQVHAFATQARDLLPGAEAWLERNRGRLDNKYHASKFYLLAVVLPWIVQVGDSAGHGVGNNGEGLR